MSLNRNVVKGKWLEVKGELQKAWGSLTDNELDKTKGDVKAIRGLIRQRYGDAEENYDKMLADIIKRVEVKANAKLADVKRALKK